MGKLWEGGRWGKWYHFEISRRRKWCWMIVDTSIDTEYRLLDIYTSKFSRRAAQPHCVAIDDGANPH